LVNLIVKGCFYYQKNIIFALFLNHHKMKKLIWLVYLIIPTFLLSQTPVQITQPYNFQKYVIINKYLHVKDSISVDSIRVGNKWISAKTLFSLLINLSSQVTGTLPISNGGTGQTSASNAINALLPSQTGQAGKFPQTDGTNISWQSAGTETFDGSRAITRTSWPFGIVPGGTTPGQVLNNILYPSVAPICSISLNSGSTVREYMSAGANLSVDLNWSVNRPIACNAITGITVNSVSQDVDNPFVVNHTQTNTLTNQILVRNTNTTYTINSTSTDLSCSNSISIGWYWARYFGVFSTSNIPTPGGSSFINSSQILALNAELSTGCSKNFGSISCSNQYFVYVVNHTWCSNLAFTINTFPTDFIKVWNNLSFTNASGGVMNVDVYVSPNKYNGTITVTAN
jgi:hypothetical protein